MNGPCRHYDCTYRTSFGSCKFTACINPNYNVVTTSTTNTAGGTVMKPKPTKLKPCPFCGSDKVFVSKFQTNFFQERYSVICEDCQSHGKNCKNEQDAAEAWNRRAE